MLTASRIAELPHDIGALTRLEQLYASGCALVTLPASIGGLEELRTLHAANNRLSDLPRSISLLAQYVSRPRRLQKPITRRRCGRATDSNKHLGLAVRRDVVAGYERWTSV